MKKYSGLILDGPNDGKFMAHYDKYLEQDVLPSCSNMPVGETVKIEVLKHVEWHYGFWVPVDVTEPRQWIMDKLIHGYQPC